MKIIIPSDVYKRLRTYVLAIDTEISFLGKVEQKDDVLLVNDFVLLKQQVSYANTILDKEELGKFYESLMNKGENPSNWKVWIHSHASMSAIFSQTDEDTIKSFDLEIPTDNWFLSIVVNHAGDLNARIDIFSPIHLTVQRLEWDISFDDPILVQKVQTEIAEKVSRITRYRRDNISLKEVIERIKKRSATSIILPGEQVDIL